MVSGNIAYKAYRKGREFVARTAFYRLAYRARNWRKEIFICPICAYKGPFREQVTPDTVMVHSICPKCKSMERHRLQYLVMKSLGGEMDYSQMSMLHFAPEPYLRPLFKNWFYKYTTADLNRADVDYQTDLRDLSFEDSTFDLVYASHVLEHIKEDERALSEISRILTPTGAAVLPVPIVSTKTIEYPEPYEYGHVRAPGPDYYEKYQNHFAKVKKFSSNDFPGEFQLFIYEDRTVWPTEERPLARPMEGEKHADIVAVGYKSPTVTPVV
jgi:SAM-dependent methyltransferase